MRLLTVLICTLIASLGCATARAEQSAASNELTPASSLDQILDALDARGKNLTSFTADVARTETDSATGDESTRSGKVWYEADDGKGAARIRVAFDKKQANGKVSEDKIEYLLDGPDLIDRTYRTKTQVTRHILKPGEKLNLFKLGEGPFPLPIGQKKEDVYAAFDVKKIDPSKDDPANTVHVQLSPKSGTRLERHFKTIDVWVDLKDHMPRRVETLDKNESTIQRADLTNLQVNQTIPASDFMLPKVNAQDWQMTEEAYND